MKDSQRETNWFTFALGCLSASCLYLSLESWDTYVMTGSLATRSWAWNAEFGLIAVALQCGGLLVVRWDRLGGIFSQTIFSVLLIMWAVGLAGPFRPLDSLWPHIETLARVIACALWIRHSYVLIKALAARTAERQHVGLVN